MAQRKLMKFNFSNEDGMTTAEYAIGTVAAASFGGILLKILMSSGVEQLLAKIIQHALTFIFSALN